MNIKTIFTIITCLLMLVVNAQVTIDKEAETIEFSTPFNKQKQFSYNVKKLIFIGEIEEQIDTISYQLHIKVNRIEADTAKLSIHYTNLKQGSGLLKIFENVEARINYNFANKSYEITNVEEMTKKLVDVIEKDGKVNKDELEKTLKELKKYKNPLEHVYLRDLKPVLSHYNKKIPYNHYETDSTKVEKPFPASTKVIKFGVVEQDGDYELTYSKEVLNDGLKQQIKKQTEEALKKQFASDSTQIIEFSLKEKEVEIDIRYEQKIVFDNESGYIKRCMFLDKVMFLDTKLKDAYLLIELIDE
ncbi:hypothetical protein [Kordia sp.]|uniref:hypothetical protein n=1 Tax=Kordia sp. TaxID=1965332 RepID=UPI003D6ACCEA